MIDPRKDGTLKVTGGVDPAGAQVIASQLSVNLTRAGLIARRQGIFVVLVAIFIVATALSRNFLTGSNLLNIMRAVAILGVMAVGQTFVAIGGGLADVSAGPNVSLSAVLALGLQPTLGVEGAAVVAVIVGLVIGVLNGVLVGALRTNPVVATIGSGVVVGGITLAYTSGNTQFAQSSALSAFGTGSTLGIPNLVLAFLVVVVVAHLVLWRTTFGRRVYATGGSYEAARASGLRVRSTVLAVFVVSGVACGIAGVLIAGLLGQVNYDSGDSYTFGSIAAVAVGGTSLFGGDGSVLRTVAGVLTIGILNNIVVLLGWPLDVQVVVTGAAILVAVWADAALRRKVTS
ncbi:MAG: ABC transporter permease [Candidatus Dormibacteraeota bacterium]|nr:ABC transporter permease [Candidatus Dormibacteraeota bacterium]